MRDDGCMLSDDEEDELALLRERVYGPSGREGPAEALLRRLASLESRRRSLASTNDPDKSVDDRDDDTEIPPTPEEYHVRSRPRWHLLMLGAAVVVLSVLAFAGGLLLGHEQHPTSQRAGIPELGWVQTEEDVTPDMGVSDAQSWLEPSSVRFIGTVQNVALYIGYQGSSENICIAAYPPDIHLWTSTCSTFGVTAQVGQDFFVTVGPPDAGFLNEYGSDLEASLISESVTIYLRN